MPRSVVLLDGPIGVGKTSLGQAVASDLACGFIDGDDHSAPGPWYRSILRTCRRIVAASEDALHAHQSVIVSYPLRCTTWIFFHRTFAQKDIACHCIGLVAGIAAISARDRILSPAELVRSEEMMAQGYGRRPFSSATVRTDEYDFETTRQHLGATICTLRFGQ